MDPFRSTLRRYRLGNPWAGSCARDTHPIPDEMLERYVKSRLGSPTGPSRTAMEDLQTALPRECLTAIGAFEISPIASRHEQHKRRDSRHVRLPCGANKSRSGRAVAPAARTDRRDV